MEKTDTTTGVLTRPEEPPRGIVDPAGAVDRIRLRRFPPSALFRHAVDYYWLVEWDRRGLPTERQRILPFPCIHLVFEPGKTAFHGVVRGAYLRSLSEAGRVLGVRFKPGALRPWLGRPVASLTDRSLPLEALLPLTPEQAEARIFSRSDATAMVTAAEAILGLRPPPRDVNAELAARAIALAEAEAGPRSVSALSALLGLGERALQRLFREYVGVSPHWVIQRFRLQEAVWQLSRPSGVNLELAALASDLGFYDQAHFTQEFTRLVGRPPGDYRQSQSRNLN